MDRAALDFAIEHKLTGGGWCPVGRIAEDGIIPDHYPLTELPSGGYRKRTEWNVRDSDGTLIISPMPMSGGTLLTANLAKKYSKPLFLVDVESPSTKSFKDWLTEHSIHVLNVAGPRESTFPGIHDHAIKLLSALLDNDHPAAWTVTR